MAVNVKQNAVFPNLPRTKQLVDKDGMLTEPWQWYFSQLNRALQNTFTPEGFNLPPQTADNIALLTNSESGSVLYNSTTNKGMINENGTWKTITTS